MPVCSQINKKFGIFSKKIKMEEENLIHSVNRNLSYCAETDTTQPNAENRNCFTGTKKARRKIFPVRNLQLILDLALASPSNDTQQSDKGNENNSPKCRDSTKTSISPVYAEMLTSISEDSKEQLPRNFELNKELPDNFDLNQELPDNFDSNEELPDDCNSSEELANHFNSNEELPNNFGSNEEVLDNFGSNEEVPDNFDLNKELPGEKPAESKKPIICTTKITEKLDSFCFKTPAKIEKKDHPPLFTPKMTNPTQLQNSVQKIQCSIDVRSRVYKPYKCSARKAILPPGPPNTFTPGFNIQKENIANQNEAQNSISVESKQSYIVVNNIAYIVLGTLGKGGSSVVYDCYDQRTRLQYAIKCVDLNQDAITVKGYINEVEMLHKLQNCDRIIKMFGYQIDQPEKRLFMVLEKGGADLSQMLKDLSLRNNHIPMYMLIYYWMQMLLAVKEIHYNGIIHSDLKPANFINTHDGLKLIDFGIASCIHSDMTSVVKNIATGTFSYISPESLKDDSSSNPASPNYGKQKYKISYKSDVWSLGCILYQLVYRRTPFQHIGNMSAKIMTILDPNHKIEYPTVEWLPVRIANTMKACLQYDMYARPSVEELLQLYEMYC